MGISHYPLLGHIPDVSTLKKKKKKKKKSKRSKNAGTHAEISQKYRVWIQVLEQNGVSMHPILRRYN